MSYALKETLAASSTVLQKSAFYVAVAGLGLSATWWAGGGDLESKRPIPVESFVGSTQTAETRPAKNDVLAVLPQKPSSEIGPAASAREVTLPIPAIVRTSAEPVRKPATPKRRQSLESFERCLPACETRDPLASSNRTPLQAVRDVALEEATPARQPVGFGDAVMEGGSEFISRAVYASRQALGTGRSAILLIVDAVR
jgi:hypothetical protein